MKKKRKYKPAVFFKQKTRKILASVAADTLDKSPICSQRLPTSKAPESPALYSSLIITSRTSVLLPWGSITLQPEREMKKRNFCEVWSCHELFVGWVEGKAWQPWTNSKGKERRRSVISSSDWQHQSVVILLWERKLVRNWVRSCDQQPHQRELSCLWCVRGNFFCQTTSLMNRRVRFERRKATKEHEFNKLE